MLKKILESYKKGELSEEEAEEKIIKLFYEESDTFFLDLFREKRIGFPEVVFAEGKSNEQLISIVRKILDKKDIVIISRVTTEKQKILNKVFSNFKIRKANNVVIIKKDITPPTETLGTVGIITGGTSDVPYAEECAIILEELGVNVIRAYDVGVAGIHRPVLALRGMKKVANLLIVFAGMEGILPTLIASLTDLPIIAVPTPIGYGLGGEGEGALTTMLQSCVPGILVVNVGNTIGAAAGAIRILREIKRRGQVGKDKKNKKGN